jgi:hypothetical protein
MWPWSGDRYRLSRYRLCRRGGLTLLGVGVPSRIYRAPAAAAVNDGRLALVDAVIVTVPTHDVAFVRHVAPLRISGLVGMAYPYVKAYSRRYRSRERQYESKDPHARQLKPSRSKRNAAARLRLVLQLEWVPCLPQ